MMHGLVGKPVDSCFEDAEKTGKLLLNNRNLREFPNSCDKYDVEDVYIIELSNNKFKKVPDIFRKCMILTRLNLHNNFIREFSSDLKNLYSLKELILSRNSLVVFPLILTTYNLELLDISCNRLKTIPEDIRFLEKLKVLDLSSNSLKMLPSTIGQLGNLRCLNISRNKLERVPEELQYCPLMKLNLSFNKLHMIPPSFRHLIGLQEINLESNPLRHPPAKLCSLGKAHIFKYLSLLASHLDESNLSREEINSQKRFKEAQERSLYRPDSTMKSHFDEFEIDSLSPTLSQMSLTTPSIPSALDDYKLTTPDVQESFTRVDSSHGQDYNSIYLDFLRINHNSNEDVEVGFGKDDNKHSEGLLRPKRTRKSEMKRKSSQYDSEQKPVLSMYATLPRTVRRSVTPTGEHEGSASLRIQPRVRPVLKMSPFMRRPFENSGSDEHVNNPPLDTRKSLENSQEEGQSTKLIHRQINQVARAESTRSSSTSANYFAAPYAYVTDLRRSTSNKYISHTPDATMDDRNRTKNSNPQNKQPPERPPSPASDASTVSDTPTPKASPEPREILVSTLIPQEQRDLSKSTPPPPPPRTFTKQLSSKLASEKGQVAKLSIDKGNSGAAHDSDKYFKTKRCSPTEDQGNLTIKRREYNVHILTSQIDYVVSEVKDRIGIEIQDFDTFIQDGVLACKLVNLVQPNLVPVHVPEKNKVLSTIQVTLNIEKFLEGCQYLRVPTNYMCTAADIVHGQDLSKVLKNFVYLLNSSSV